jgi:hypothetical protein
MDPRWISIVGLGFDIVGAWVLGFGLIISKKDALRLGSTRWMSEDDDENTNLPQVRDRLNQSRNAIAGMTFLTAGFVLQAIGGWPR